MQNVKDILRLAADDLAVYAMAEWPHFRMAPHHRMVIEALEAVARGELSKLAIFMPPRHGKSLLGSQLFPSWYGGRYPRKSIILCTHTEDAAADFGRQVRRFVQDDPHKLIFPDCRLERDASAAHRLTFDAGGTFYAAGVGSALVGRGADLLILDDVHKDRASAMSPVSRKAVLEWYRDVASTRLQSGGAIVLLQTRWCEGDLPGTLLSIQHDWKVICLPALAEAGDILHRAVGEPLWADEFSREWLLKKREEIGLASFSGLYQQAPSVAEGAVFRLEWFRTYTPKELPEKFGRVIMSLDTAFKTGTENDYSAATVWGVSANAFYLLHTLRQRLEFPELKKQVRMLADQFHPSTVLIEDKASGQSLAQELARDSRLPVKAVKVDHDKQTRAAACAPLFECGKVFVPAEANWLPDYLDEMASFPSGRFDDQVDSTSMALNWLRTASDNQIRVFSTDGRDITSLVQHVKGDPDCRWQLSQLSR